MATVTAATAVDDSRPSKKRPRVDDDDNDQGNDNQYGGTSRVIIESTKSSVAAVEEAALNRIITDNSSNSNMFELARQRLSKWAARLFDPNRPRGLIEPPQTIPLNDDFLQAFGRREKQHDESMGRSIDIDYHIDIDEADIEARLAALPTTIEKEEMMTASRKVKIQNLKFTTTRNTLELACSRFGPIETVNLIMDKESNTHLNKGLAYVVFDHAESAQECIRGLTELDGRPLRVHVVADMKATMSHPLSSRNGASGTSALTRYWMRDITTKCHQCGQVGHIAAHCPNEPKPKPCPMCGSTDHDFRECQKKVVCFNCGIPGHVSRECPYNRSNGDQNNNKGKQQQQQVSGPPPRRIVCTLCYQSGHSKIQCRRPTNGIRGGINAVRVPSVEHAICMSCGARGHFLCRDLKWFHGLDGVSCANCGQWGHSYFQCNRPNLDECARSEEVVQREWGRAATWSAQDRFPADRGSNEQRGNRSIRYPESNNNFEYRGRSPPGPSNRRDGNIDHSRNRAASMPQRGRQANQYR